MQHPSQRFKVIELHHRWLAFDADFTFVTKHVLGDPVLVAGPAVKGALVSAGLLGKGIRAATRDARASIAVTYQPIFLHTVASRFVSSCASAALHPCACSIVR